MKNINIKMTKEVFIVTFICISLHGFLGIVLSKSDVKESVVFDALVSSNVNIVVARQQSGSSTGDAVDGTSCEVTEGINKGKKGVYTDGGTWCEGSWGGTECGNSRCKTAKKPLTNAGWFYDLEFEVQQYEKYR